MIPNFEKGESTLLWLSHADQSMVNRVFGMKSKLQRINKFVVVVERIVTFGSFANIFY